MSSRCIVSFLPMRAKLIGHHFLLLALVIIYLLLLFYLLFLLLLLLLHFLCFLNNIKIPKMRKHTFVENKFSKKPFVEYPRKTRHVLESYHVLESSLIQNWELLSSCSQNLNNSKLKPTVYNGRLGRQLLLEFVISNRKRSK
jgi:hypothetical protein